MRAHVAHAIYYEVNPRLCEVYMGCEGRDKGRPRGLGSEPRDDVRSEETGKDEYVHPGEPPRWILNRGEHMLPVRIPCTVVPRSVVGRGQFELMVRGCWGPHFTYGALRADSTS